MNKRKREITARILEINTRYQEMAEVLETEKRELTDLEQTEKRELLIEKQKLQLEFERLDNPAPEQRSSAKSQEVVFEDIVNGIKERSISDDYRNMVENGNTIVFRAGSVQDSSTVGAITPLTIGAIIEPLEKGLILNKVGCKMQYGMNGAWQFPIVAGVEASVYGEDVEISDSKIDIDKVAPKPRRVALSIPVTYQAQNRSADRLFGIVTEQIAMSLTRVLNKWMFSVETLAGTDGGCFVNPKAKVEYTDKITYKDAVALKGQVMKTGVVFDGTPAYVCTASTYADLESTPRDAGSGLMIIENGKINGFPVFVTEYFKEESLGFGVFSYMMVGQFGDLRLTVDPYTQAKKDRIVFTLNSEFDMLPLRTEAFGILTKKVVAPK